MSEWKEYKLSEIMEIIGGGTPKTSMHEYWNGAIPWLSVVDFGNDRKVVFETEKKITEKGLKESSTKVLKKGQIIISARGTVGALAVLGKDMAFNQSCYGLNAKEDLTFNDYLYYLVKDNISSLLNNTHGAVFDTITRETFDHISVKLPPLPEQQSIASVLSSLDDKIGLLHRQNKTLEALAETLFRQWFVEEGEEGWETGKLGDIADFYNGKSRPESSEGGSVPIYGGNGILGYTVQSNADGMSIIIGRVGAYCGSLYIENKPIWITDNALSAKPKNGRYTSYLFYLLKSLNLNQMAEGSSHPLITQTLLNAIEVIIPSNEKLHAFCDYADNMREKIFFNQSQIHTLTRLRDTLLPKLMSGEVRVKLEQQEAGI